MLTRRCCLDRENLLGLPLEQGTIYEDKTHKPRTKPEQLHHEEARTRSSTEEHPNIKMPIPQDDITIRRHAVMSSAVSSFACWPKRPWHFGLSSRSLWSVSGTVGKTERIQHIEAY